jgi:type II secretory ATPase GspE/PulE/Tfp pilus assembly ATPase PilB-like protein
MAGLLDFATVRIDPAQAGRLPRAFAFRRQLLPLSEIGGALHFACAYEPDEATKQLLMRQTKAASLVFHAAEAGALRRELMRVYGAGLDTQGKATPEDAVALADELFRAARLRRASDIHVDPGRDAVKVRFRVDGLLEDYRTFPLQELAPLVSRIKVLAGMDIAERRAPQDGAFTLPALPDDPASEADARVATLPIRHGERVTVRLLSADRANLTLEKLGMRPEHLTAVERVLASPHGLFLLTGPTGSGKSTTLYACIRRLVQQGGMNILTVEDPIEYEMDGVGQAEVDSADKVSFTKALRSLLRQDPDVIMIGEIRDAESLDAAVKAALTGHLVLSTLHTNSAVGAVTRLADMGLAFPLIAATLRMCIAQRLVRRLCPHCRLPSSLGDLDAQLLRSPEAAGKPVFVPGGCLACSGRGYSGRIALFELFAPDDETAEMIAKGVEEHELMAHLAARNYQTLYHDALAKLFDGTVAMADVRREL